MSGTKFKMLNDFILVKLIQDDEKSESGILLPEEKGERTDSRAIKAEVIQSNSKSPEIKKGMIVYIGKWEMHHATIKGNRYAMVKSEWVFMEVE